MSDHISLSRICDEATEAGGWIDSPFEAIVRNAKAGRGKQPSKADLVDPADPRVKVEACYFGGSFLDLEGSVVRFSGKGRKAKLYEGNVEVSLYEKATVFVVGDAPAATRAAPAARGDAPKGDGGGAKGPGPGAKADGDPTAHFHKEMKKAALLWVHSFQYAVETESKLKAKLPEPLFQSLVSSLFITAKDRGLLDRPPAPRALDGKGFPVPYVPPQPDPAAIEEAKKKLLDEAARKVEDELRRKQEAEVDPDVPF